MSLKPALAALSDAALHACSLPSGCFRYTDHLRLARLHLHQHLLEVATGNVRDGI